MSERGRKIEEALRWSGRRITEKEKRGGEEERYSAEMAKDFLTQAKLIESKKLF